MMKIIIAVLLWIAWIDGRTQKIPRYLLLLYAAAACAAVWLQPDISLWQHVIGIAAVSVPMVLLRLLIPGSWGMGDIWLGVISGWLLGVKQVLLAAYLAILLSGCYSIGVLLLKRKKKKSRIPFAPFWAAGVIITLFWGEMLLGWYEHFLH